MHKSVLCGPYFLHAIWKLFMETEFIMKKLTFVDNIFFYFFISLSNLLFALQLDGSIIAPKAPFWLFMCNTIWYKSNLQRRSQRQIFRYYSKGKRAKMTGNGAFRCVKYHATSQLNPGKKIDIHSKRLFWQKNSNWQYHQCMENHQKINQQYRALQTWREIPQKLLPVFPFVRLPLRLRQVVGQVLKSLSYIPTIMARTHWSYVLFVRLIDLKRTIFYHFSRRDSVGHSEYTFYKTILLSELVQQS